MKIENDQNIIVNQIFETNGRDVVSRLLDGINAEEWDHRSKSDPDMPCASNDHDLSV